MAKKKWRRVVRPEYDHMVFDVLHALEGRKATEIANATWVSPSTIRKWRKGPVLGGTRYPQHMTLAAVAAVAGLKFVLVPERVAETATVKKLKPREEPRKRQQVRAA